MTQLRTTMVALGIITLVIMTMIPMQAIAKKQKEIELSEEGQTRYNELKEGYITYYSRSFTGAVSESQIREVMNEVFGEPFIMKEFAEAWQYANEVSEVSQFNKQFEEWMSIAGNEINEKIAEIGLASIEVN
jgi:uncharacterized protein YnzC (UPF0291/DUF896 family)